MQARAVFLHEHRRHNVLERLAELLEPELEVSYRDAAHAQQHGQALEERAELVQVAKA